MDDYSRRQAEQKRQERIKRARLRGRIIIVETLLIIVLIIALVVVSINFAALKKQVANENNSSNVAGTDSLISSSLTVSNSPQSSQELSSEDAEKEAMKAELDKWYMFLVNPDKSVTNDFINNVELGEISGKYTSGAQSSKYLDARIVETFNKMCKAAADDGVTLISVSSYRTYSYQQTLYKNRVQRCINEGLSEEDAKKKAATIVAFPGTSEHHLGLAVDINSVEESFENTKAFRWLSEHAEEYGFILRYPKDKQSITKIIYEPWHYRYVGVEHAKAMNDLGMCMEEYVEYLKSGGVKNN